MRKQVTLLILLTACVASAQRPKFGPVLEAHNGYAPQIVGESEDELYAMNMRANDLILESFDKRTLRQNYFKEYELDKEMGVVERFEGMDYYNDQYVYFRSFFHRKEDRFDLVVQAIDPDNARKLRPKTLVSKKTEKNLDRGFYDVHTSRKGKSLLVHTLTYYKSKDRTIEKLILFDKDFEKVTEREYNRTGEHSDPVIKSLLIDDEGNAYFVKNKSVVILDAFADYEEWKEPLAVEEMATNSKLTDVTASFDKDLNFVINATYVTVDTRDTDANKSRSDRKEGDTQVEGVFYMKIDGLRKEVVASRINFFDNDFIQKFKTEKQRRKGYKGEMSDNFLPYRMHFMEDGSMVATNESFEYYAAYDRSGNRVAESYSYGDIVAYKFDPEGKLMWAKNIPRNQEYKWSRVLGLMVFGSHGFSFLVRPSYVHQHFSYSTFIEDGNFNIMYNDHLENLSRSYEKKEPKEFKKIKNSMPVVQEIDLETGKRDRNIVKNMQRSELKMVTRRNHYSVDDEALYYVCRHKGEYCLVKI